jgi:arginyl-tRNA--protein-N-Asp/Glu arginylyltransferase
MILMFSEARWDYGRYQFPYVIWALREAGETPAALMQQGFVPASPRLDRFYLCRNLRVDLARYRASTENRRILRKGEGIGMELVARADFKYEAARREAWQAYADHRFGKGVMSRERLDGLMSSELVTHVLVFRDVSAEREVGTALLYVEAPVLAYYHFAFYDLEYLDRNLGMLMMTRAVEWFASGGVRHLHVGTCYSERALYKTRFSGLEFFNGARWSSDLEELKHLVRRSPEEVHLLESGSFLDRFYGGDLERLAKESRFRIRVEGSDAGQ